MTICLITSKFDCQFHFNLDALIPIFVAVKILSFSFSSFSTFSLHFVVKGLYKVANPSKFFWSAFQLKRITRLRCRSILSQFQSWWSTNQSPNANYWPTSQYQYLNVNFLGENGPYCYHWSFKNLWKTCLGCLHNLTKLIQSRVIIWNRFHRILWILLRKWLLIVILVQTILNKYHRSN